MSSRASPVPALAAGNMEPKKSVRLAEKRKLREETGGPHSQNDDDFYFTPYHQFTKSSSPSRAGRPQSVNLASSTATSQSNSPTPKKAKIRSNAESPTESVSPITVSPVTTTPSARSTPTKSQTGMGKGGKTGNTFDASIKPLNFDENSTSSSSASVTLSNSGGKKKTSKTSGGNNGAAGEELEEEQWLDALESGKLEDVDEELRQLKNPKLLTARQRAILEKKDGTGGNSPCLFAIDTGKEKTVITQEMIRLKMEKSEKRRQLAQEKKESDQKRTMDRLLKKQHSKPLKSAARPRVPRTLDCKITYISKPDGNLICFPTDYPMPLAVPHPPKPISLKICGAQGCGNPKKYSCSKTGIPLCSLECYKKNLLMSSIYR